MIMDVNLTTDQTFNVQFMESRSTIDTNMNQTTPSGGKDGLSAYEVAVKNGFKGTEQEWLASLKGEKGDAGEDGKTPVKGKDYFTESDKEEMVNSVLNALPRAEGVLY